MSMISEQVKRLREKANEYFDDMISDDIFQAADTIEALSAKLAAANMERSERYYGGGWIPCDKNNLPQGVNIFCDKDGLVFAGSVYKGVEIDEDDIVVLSPDVIRVHYCRAYMPMPEPYKPDGEVGE